MFGAKLGGLEQVFVDYSEALAARGHRMTNFVAPGALCAAPLRALGQDVVEIGNAGLWTRSPPGGCARRLSASGPPPSSPTAIAPSP